MDIYMQYMRLWPLAIPLIFAVRKTGAEPSLCDSSCDLITLLLSPLKGRGGFNRWPFSLLLMNTALV